MPKYNEFPLRNTIADDDIFTFWDKDTGSTCGIKAIDLRKYFGGATITNISGFATATASSFYSSSFHPSYVNDGNSNTEWASLGEQSPWVQLTFQTEKNVSRIRLSDRPNPEDWATGGDLLFSDGSSISVTGINNNGGFKIIEFPEKRIEWIRFQIVGTGPNVGLAEFEVWGY